MYYALCAYWIISGLGHAASTYHTAITPIKMSFLGVKQTLDAPGFTSFGSILGFSFSAFQILVGIGLAARVEQRASAGDSKGLHPTAGPPVRQAPAQLTEWPTALAIILWEAALAHCAVVNLYRAR